MICSGLDKLVNSLFECMRNQGYMESTIKMYRRPFNKLIALSKKMNTDGLTSEVKTAFLSDTRNERTGKQSLEKTRLRVRCIKLLEELQLHGSFNFTPYTKSRKQPFCFEGSKKIYADFEFYLKSESVSQATRDSILLIGYRFLHYLEALNIKTIDNALPSVVPGFFGEISKTWKPESMHIVIYGLGKFLKFADKKGDLLACVPKSKRSKIIIPTLNKNEESALWKVIQSNFITSRDRAILLLSMLMGLRSSDIIQLKIIDLDWSNDTLSLIQRKTGIPLILPLVPAVGNAIMEYILCERPNSSSSHVFLRYEAPHKPFTQHSACYAISKKIFHLANIRKEKQRKGLHLLRHYAASKMLSKGVAVQTISSLLGHSDPNTTKLYLSTDKEKLCSCCLPLPASLKEA